MRLCPILSVVLATLTLSANAVVVRHDVSDAKYHAEDKAIPALADIPCEGHGVLIAPRWVVTAAHVVTWQHEPIGEVTINGKPRKVASVIVHGGYKPMIPVPPKGDITPFNQFLASRDDIALIELKDDVTDAEPMPLYAKTDELGKLATFYGKGATGDGVKGVDPHASHRTRLRQGFNQVSMAEGKWLGTVFDKGPDAHPLEAYTGGGDSGGPLVIERDDKRWLAGLASYSYCEGDIADCKPGFYGSHGRQVRISAYADWIQQTIRKAQ